MSARIFIAAAGMGRRIEGEALVAKDGFSARYDLDRVRGVFSRPAHKLAGESYVGRVLVLDAAKGGVATAWMLHEMKARGVIPAALVLNAVNPIMVQGAALADFTMISGFAERYSLSAYFGCSEDLDPGSVRRGSTAFSDSIISLVRRMIHTGLPRHSTTAISPGAMCEMSASTGAPTALARSEGHMLATKGTAAATPAAPPATEVATTSLRRFLFTFISSFMEMAWFS